MSCSPPSAWRLPGQLMAVSRSPRLDRNRTSQSLATSEDGLNPKIRAAIHSKFDDILDAANWLNPQVIVVPKGVEVRSASLAGGTRTARLDELRRVLVGLPISAWPYGRVVLVTEIGLVGRLDDLELIKRNRDEAARVLKALAIEANWWPA